MKRIFGISLTLNLALLGGVVFMRVNQMKTATGDRPVLSEAKSSVNTATVSDPPSPPEIVTRPFHWSDLESSNGYRGFVANLRALGCPETSIADIVQGNVDRAFSWERGRLHLDGSGDGPWSQEQERQLIASLLSGQSPPKDVSSAQSSTALAGAGHSTPLFLQNVNWSAMGFTPDQQTEIAQVRQQFQNETASPSENAGAAASQNASGTATPVPWQDAVQNANDQLRGLLGYQGYATYEQQQYFASQTPDQQP